MTAELWGAEFKMIVTFEVQWNPVNTDTKGTCQSIRIIWVSVLNGITGKTSRSVGYMRYRCKD